MLKNYLKITIRNIQKHKLYSLINIIGLTTGITCCILIYLFISDEFSFDSFHENEANIYRVEEINYDRLQSEIDPPPFFDTRAPEGIRTSAYLPLGLGPELKDRIPEITDFARFPYSNNLVRNGDISFSELVVMTDSSFFNLFTFPLVSGTENTALANIDNVVIIEEIAKKYFGNQNAIGKTLTLTIFGEEKDFTISAVAKNPPKNSSLNFALAIRIENRPYYEVNLPRWNSYNTPVFVELTPEANLEEVHLKLAELAEEKYGERMVENREQFGLPQSAIIQEFVLSPISEIHLNASINWHKVSNTMYSYILAFIALLILLIACINYITLALAKSSSRAKEVGIRKTSGAGRTQLALQFWGETQLLTLLAMFAGICLAEILLPFFNSIADKSLSINYISDWGFLMALFGVTLVTGLIAGTYPALILSGYQPVKALKNSSTFQFKPRLTKSLLVLQYSLSIFLIISASVMYKQLEFISSTELGYNEDQVVVVPTFTGFNDEGERLMEQYKSELNSIPSVENVSGMSPAFTRGTSSYSFDVDGVEKLSYIYYIDEQLISTLNFQITAGRTFSEERISDRENSIIVNEALVASMGWENPVGELLPWRSEENPSSVVGVVKDFHFQSLETAIKPMLFHMDPEYGSINYITVKLGAGSIAETIPVLEEKWAKVSANSPFNYWFLDEAVENQYADYQRWLKIIGASTIMAILIACMGLFGLAGLTAVNKTKEIGIRKVLGAGIDQIVLLLNKDLVILIGAALLISSPISWYIMEKWLSDFTYRISISVDIFIISALFALLIAITTVSYHTLKASLANPVDSLKNE